MRGSSRKHSKGSGLKKGDRVATLAMNHGRHLVAWYGAAGMGGLIHTINPRLFDDQLAFIANHAEDKCCSTTAPSRRSSSG
jgi:acyl-CoA synthetase (AMP-forming)/AMP-acid ligase II